MNIRIIADSASDLTEKESKYLKILPLQVTVEETQYLDGITLTHEEFYNKLVESDKLPKTSQIPPFEFEEAIRETLDAGEIPIVITLASKLSGTYNSARIAASEFDEKVYVIDSENVAIGEKILVQYAIQMVEEGLDVETIVEELEKGFADTYAIAESNNKIRFPEFLEDWISKYYACFQVYIEDTEDGIYYDIPVV